MTASDSDDGDDGRGQDEDEITLFTLIYNHAKITNNEWENAIYRVILGDPSVKAPYNQWAGFLGISTELLWNNYSLKTRSYFILNKYQFNKQIETFMSVIPWPSVRHTLTFCVYFEHSFFNGLFCW